MADNKAIAAILGAAGLGLALFGLSKKVGGQEPPPPPPGYANVFGVVTDQVTSQPISGVTITISEAQVVTGSAGNYAFTDLLPGEYTIIFGKVGYQSASVAVSLIEGNNQADHQLIPTAPPTGDEPEILSLTIPSTSSGAQFWPEATLLLPPADRYILDLHIDPAHWHPQSGWVNIMSFSFAATIPDPNSLNGALLTPLDEPSDTYSLRGGGYQGKNLGGVGDPALLQAIYAADAAARAAWAEVVEDQNRLTYLESQGYHYPDPIWVAARAMLQESSDHYNSGAPCHPGQGHSFTTQHQEAIDAYYASKTPDNYVREVYPAQAIVITIQSYNLPPGDYRVLGSITRSIGAVNKVFNFGEVGILRVI